MRQIVVAFERQSNCDRLREALESTGASRRIFLPHLPQRRPGEADGGQAAAGPGGVRLQADGRKL